MVPCLKTIYVATVRVLSQVSWKHVVLKLAPDNSPVYNSARVGRVVISTLTTTTTTTPICPGDIRCLCVLISQSSLLRLPVISASESSGEGGRNVQREEEGGLSDTPNLFQKWLRVTNEPSPLCLMSPLSPDCNHCLSFRSLNFQTTEHKNQIHEAGARLVLLSSLSVLC